MIQWKELILHQKFQVTIFQLTFHIARKRKGARVWEHIESYFIDGKEKAIYKYCKLKLSSEPGQGTNHLSRHIGMYCPSIPSGERNIFLLHWKHPYSDGDHPIFDPQVCYLLIAKSFVSAEIAFWKADDPNWKNLLNYIHPSFWTVGRQFVRSYCLVYCMRKLRNNCIVMLNSCGPILFWLLIFVRLIRIWVAYVSLRTMSMLKFG